MQNNDKQKHGEFQKLFVNWLIHLLDERYGVSGWESAAASHWSVTLTDGSTIQVRFKPSGQPDVQGPAKYEGNLGSIVEDADRRTVARDYGTGAWWMLASRTDMFGSGAGVLHLMRLRKEHMPRRFQGDWSLGSDALVSFRQGKPSMAPFPRFDVDIAFRVPGPGRGPFAEEQAQKRGVVLRAATSFATAAPLLSPTVFVNIEGLAEETIDKLDEAWELPVDTAEESSLWPQVTVLAEGIDQSAEDVRRVQGAMFAYEQAMRQESEYVTIVLLVSALEALSVPNTEWQDKRVTARFLKFVQELCPDAVREVIKDENFGEAYASYTSSRRFLETLYASRSKPLHTGYLQHGITAPLGGKPPLRVMLVSGLVRAAIVEFLRRPFRLLSATQKSERSASAVPWHTSNCVEGKSS